MPRKMWTAVKHAGLPARNGLMLAAGLLISLAGAARADMPAVLDIAPKDAVAVIGAQGVSRLEKNMGALSAAAQMQPIPITAMMTMLGLKDGVAMDKPFAIILMPGDMSAPVPPILAVVPVTDYASMITAMGGKPEGVSEVKLQGDTFYVKPLAGGLAAMSPVKDILDKFEGKGGNMPAHTELVGKLGQDVIESSDVFVFFHHDQMKRLMDQGFNPMQGPLKNLMAQGMGIKFGGGAATLMKNATGMVIGARAGAMGVSLDLTANYTPGSDMAKAFADAGDSKPLLKNLPAEPVLLAWAFDISKPGARSLVNLMAGERTPSDLMLDPVVFTKTDRINSYSGVVYPNPAGLFGGFMSRGVRHYGVADSADFLSEFRQTYTALNNQADANVQISTAFNLAASQVDGASVSTYSMKVMGVMGGTGTPLALFFGPKGGPDGHVVALKSGVYATTNTDPKILSKTIALGDAGKGPSISEDKPLAQVASMLPDNRMGEVYLGVKAVIDQVTPLITMSGRQIDYTPPDDLPPVGVGVVSSGGMVKASVVIPAPVIQAVQKMQAAMQPPPGPDGAPAPAAKPAEKKPGF